jgi:four helix bundle protein
MEERKDKIFDIRERTFQFSVELIKFFRTLELRKIDVQLVGKQMLRSGTSVGAMCKEAAAAESDADFVHKYQIALKEARETHHWLRLIYATQISTSEEVKWLGTEIAELKKILAAIIVKKKAKKK